MTPDITLKESAVTVRVLYQVKSVDYLVTSGATGQAVLGSIFTRKAFRDRGQGSGNWSSFIMKTLRLCSSV